MSKRFGRNQKRKLKEELSKLKHQVIKADKTVNFYVQVTDRHKADNREIVNLLNGLTSVVGNYFLGVFGTEFIMDNVPEVLQMIPHNCKPLTLADYDDPKGRALDAVVTLNRLAVLSPDVFNDCINNKIIVSLRARGSSGYSIALNTSMFDVYDRQYVRAKVMGILEKLADGCTDAIINNKMINSRLY